MYVTAAEQPTCTKIVWMMAWHGGGRCMLLIDVCF
jgi:hypothetical protein